MNRGVILDYGFMDPGGVVDADVRQGVFEGLLSRRVCIDSDQYIDFTASAALGASYRFSDRYVLDLRNTGTWVDYETWLTW